MAETLAIIGLVAAIVQFVDFGLKIGGRLNTFKIDNVANTFRDIMTKLPLLLVTLKRTKEQAEAGLVNEDTQKALLPVVEGCHSQVELPNETLVKTLPTIRDSSWKRRIKALSGLGQEKKVQQIITALRNYVQTLTYHQATGVSKQNLKVETTTIIPFSRNTDFVGREEIFNKPDKKFNSKQDGQPKVALCGLGGVG